MKTREEIQGFFKAKGVPLTHQRLAVYEELAGRTDHPSAESLYEALKKNYPSLSLATVYKTMQTLLEMGMAARVPSLIPQARYDARMTAHHHAACVACGKIVDVFEPRLDSVAVPALPGFEIAGHSIHFHGRCAKCAKAGRSKTN